MFKLFILTLVVGTASVGRLSVQSVHQPSFLGVQPVHNHALLVVNPSPTQLLQPTVPTSVLQSTYNPQQ